MNNIFNETETDRITILLLLSVQLTIRLHMKHRNFVLVRHLCQLVWSHTTAVVAKVANSLAREHTCTSSDGLRNSESNKITLYIMCPLSSLLLNSCALVSSPFLHRHKYYITDNVIIALNSDKKFFEKSVYFPVLATNGFRYDAHSFCLSSSTHCVYLAFHLFLSLRSHSESLFCLHTQLKIHYRQHFTLPEISTYRLFFFGFVSTDREILNN